MQKIVVFFIFILIIFSCKKEINDEVVKCSNKNTNHDEYKKEMPDFLNRNCLHALPTYTYISDDLYFKKK